MSPRARLRDVAAAAATSPKTVSRVINGDPRVSAETRCRVERAVRKLGYQPDPLARSLRRGTDDTVGVVVDSVADPFFASVAGQIERIARSKGITVMVASTNQNPEHEREVVARMAQRRVAGLIVAPISGDHAHLDGLSCPVVFVDRRATGMEADSVVADDHGGAHTAVRHLVDHGHRRIAFIGHEPELDTVRRRLGGYRAALREAGITEEFLVASSPDREEIVDATARLLASRRPPTAIFSASVRGSMRVLPLLHRLGRLDVGFVAFGDPPLADSLTPGVTVIDHAPEVVGQLAAARLMDRIDGRPLPAEVITVPLRLIPRGSGEVPA